MTNGQRFSELLHEKTIINNSLNMILLYKHRYNLKGLPELIDMFESELARIDQELASLNKTGVVL